MKENRRSTLPNFLSKNHLAGILSPSIECIQNRIKRTTGVSRNEKTNQRHRQGKMLWPENIEIGKKISK